MINKTLLTICLATSIFVSHKTTMPPTTAAVVLAGSIVSSQHDINVKKYKRKDCPVCKGKGWYISGDGIERVDCGYCEPDSKQSENNSNKTIKVIR